MMTTDAIQEMQAEILALTDVIVAASLRAMRPAADELTKRQAESEFDRTWLAYQVSRGRIRGRRKGAAKNSPVMFSRTELLALKEAERRVMIR